MDNPDIEAVRTYLMDLQDRVSAALEAEDGEARFQGEVREDKSGGLARPRVLSAGPVLEGASVVVVHTAGDRLPQAASVVRPELSGCPFEAVSLSIAVHPRNPYAPSAHADLRLFVADPPTGTPAWWFGGGFDLTPYYGFEADAAHWHQTAQAACEPFGHDVYPRMKRACDEYSWLPHRGEMLGIGGLFFDGYADGGFERSFAFLCSVGDHFLAAYLPVLRRRKAQMYGKRERDFQLYRRGRSVEFELLYDRRTRGGLQAGNPAESILAGLPPAVLWRHDWRPDPGSPEADLYNHYLVARDWTAEAGV